tara:strand:- start:380 stop:637 length:258 start_codon:yes stop_codon:yes gene_type:complete
LRGENMIKLLVTDDFNLRILITEDLDILKTRKLIRKSEKIILGRKELKAIIIELRYVDRINENAYQLINRRMNKIKGIPVVIITN